MNEFISIDLIPLLSAIMVGVSCALLGNFLVLRKLSLMGDAISHTVLPGIVISFLIFDVRGGPLLLVGALCSGILTTVLVELTAKATGLDNSSSMGVVFSSLFAFGVLLMEQASAKKVDLDAECLLYGQLEGLLWYPPPGVSFWESLSYLPIEFFTLLCTMALTFAFVIIFFKELRLASFDPGMASSLGFNATFIHYLQMIMTAVAIVAAFEAVGSILVIGMLICPAATARLLTDKLRTQLVLSVLIAFTTTVVGYFFATRGLTALGLDLTLNVAGTMLVVALIIFILTALLAPRYGIFAQNRNRTRLSLNMTIEDILGTAYRINETSNNPISIELIKQKMSEVSNISAAIKLGAKLGFYTLVNDDLYILLTDSGIQRAKELIHSHRLWEGYLHENTELPTTQLHNSAEALRHFTSKQLALELAKGRTPDPIDPNVKD